MKAWTITAPDKDESLVIFHKHGVAARRLGANELNRDFNEVECRRSKEFDEYAESGTVPPMALLENDWWVTCFGCHKTIYKDDGPVAGSDEILSIYCSAECKRAQPHD